MKVLVIGLGGVTNGGKTTLAKRLRKQLPNCSILAQDDFFKPESEVEVDEHGFKQYDVLDALYMEEMVTSIRSWMKNPTGSSVSTTESKSTPVNLKSTEEVHILIVEGFLLYNYEPLNEVWDRRYFLTIPYEECKRRRSTRVYQPADGPGYFDGHVWPMYLKHKTEMEENTNNIVYLDGTKSEEDLFSYVYNDIMRELEAWKKEVCSHMTAKQVCIKLADTCQKLLIFDAQKSWILSLGYKYCTTRQIKLQLLHQRFGYYS